MSEVAVIHQRVYLLIESIWLWLKYFFFFPIFSFFPPPFPYLFARYLSRLDYLYNVTKKRSMKKWMVELLGRSHFSRKELDLATRRYFEVIYCDEIDNFIYLFGFSKSFIRRLKIEGEGNLSEALRSHGGFLLCTHFGGGFWILPFLRDKGMKVQFYSPDIKKEDYPYKKAFYAYLRFSNWMIQKVFNRRIIYKREGKESIIKALKEGKWVTTAFDVPPYLVRENMEVQFLGKKTRFPKGLFSIAKEVNAPILPFFSYLDKGKGRKICFEKPIDVMDERECVENCIKMVERKIKEKPDHWHLWPFADQFFSQP